MRTRRCLTSRELLKHHQKCTNQSCPVCTPVKQYVQKQRLVMQKQVEMARERDARAAAYGNAGGQAMMQARAGRLIQHLHAAGAAWHSAAVCARS